MPSGTYWLVLVDELAVEQDWQLTSEVRVRYAKALHALWPIEVAPAKARRICMHYHFDHAVQLMLLDSTHPRYSAGWEEWSGMALRFLHSAGCCAYTDATLATEDLAQITLLELWHSLPSFSFTSRLTTWAHAVVVRTARRIYRDRLVRKRTEQRFVLAAQGTAEEALPEQQHPVALVEADALERLACDLLLKTADERLVRIFLLHARHDLTSEQIAPLVDLHPSRVRSLMKQARGIVRHHPALQAWCAAD
ncbi:MAG: RNA polymerase sigma factor [Candidatus Viridilinea halotolerans]|uniref:RNA polymerase sigma factor n=1 Tax=Candidatus Viridilinea halotolerans TaxID=2491704 RepID=A0A426U0Y0_9CHLR|nr:MAG: RNA polymerase sigma factor [Candidatus Viridilinea halotolerans]